MRLRALFPHYARTTRLALVIFISCYTAGTLFGAVLSTGAGGLLGYTGSDTGSFDITLFSFVVFTLVYSLIGAGQDARFLISRSVSRKEVFLSNSLFLLPLAAVLAALQIAVIMLSNLVRMAFGLSYRGLSLDVQVYMAPDMATFPAFFAVSMAILFMIGALSFLFGTLFARWKVQTIGLAIILALLLLSSLALPGVFPRIVEIFRYMFTDMDTGFVIALKHFALGLALLCIAFPIFRGIEAAKRQ